MKKLNLPMVAMSTRLGAALARLKDSKRAALLSEHEGEYHLFRAENIAIGRYRGLKTLSDLKSHAELKPIVLVARAPGRERETRGLERTAGRNISRGKKGIVTPKPALTSGFTLVSVKADSAFLSIRNIVVAKRFAASPKDYYCDGPRHHSFPPPDVSVGDPCPRGDGHWIISGR